jgi:RimJ/RimL family protein N-acetyltransferase
MPSAQRFPRAEALLLPDSRVCQFLPWDSEFFGLRIGRVMSDRLTGSQIGILLDWCRQERIDCLYLLLDPAAEEILRRLEALGFRAVDTRVTLTRPCGKPASTVELRGVTIRAFAQPDLPDLREIARVSHRNTRFWNDPNFPRSLCEALYVRWIEKSCATPGDRVFVAELEGRPAGYIACERQESGQGRIGLFAVAETARGRGIGGGLLRSAIEWFRAEGMREISVVTQGDNEPARRAYEKQGFSVESSGLWLHYWPRAIPPANRP